MIRETLTAIGQAGLQALQGLGSQVEVRTQVTQVRDWSFAMAHLGRVTVANSPIHQIYVGISQQLAEAIGDLSRHEVLLEGFKQALVTRVPAKRPIGAWEMLAHDGRARVLRGVRSFILRQQTGAGNFYLMADVSSRGEFESMRQTGWEEELAAQLLPRDLGKIAVVDRPAAVSRVGMYLARFEHDLELHVPADDGTLHSVNGVLLQLGKQGERTLMRLSLDADKELRQRLVSGLELEASFGAAGRVFRFGTVCAGPSALPLEGVADLPCLLFTMPERFELDQRRRYFRVEPERPLVAQLQVLPPPVEDADEPVSLAPSIAPAPGRSLAVRISDLSFSGAGLVLEGESPDDLQPAGRVLLQLHGDGLPQSIALSGLVRRLNTVPCGRGRQETRLGIEFVIEEQSDRLGTHLLRQYVMAQQRQLLARRSSDAEPSPA